MEMTKMEELEKVTGGITFSNGEYITASDACVGCSAYSNGSIDILSCEIKLKNETCQRLFTDDADTFRPILR